MKSYQTIKLEVDARVATLTLNQPDTLNGLNVQIQEEMLDALAALQNDTSVGALILAGAGKAFSAGGDLRQLTEPRADGKSTHDGAADMMVQLSNPLVMALQRLPMATASAVHGAAAGAGASLALCTDVVIAARSAFFMAPFLPRLGLVPDLGMTWFLSRGVSRARGMGLMLLGDRLPAEQALDWGLIWSCVDAEQLMPEARKVAQRLARGPAGFALEARLAQSAAYRNDLVSQLHYEVERQRELLRSPVFKEGASAFLEKREPDFHAVKKILDAGCVKSGVNDVGW